MSPELTAISERTACSVATRITQQITDVLAGRRPLHQIRDRLSGPVASLLSARLAAYVNERPEYRLRSVHACLTTASRVEACAVLSSTSRVRALVLRLEQENTQWSCTMLSVV